ncbi:pirin family protein [Haloechinothrix sp. LS1_15]|uniref:pirin family protein n=1 Tax=Haloechinothrix sp. LS1_15 TaxID=2652248 RepID=UPI002946F361|nr:pirin family protein [Haloechinothrix sp. LS1_15]MDV6012481.1 pirin family protein [Haloechinothrix sp. LS1_15]
MSNIETSPAELTCSTGASDARVEIVRARDVPLGGPRAITVRRTLPQRARSLIGAWCFIDHFGPVDVEMSDGVDVPPHPHTGLQTVSWLFSGEIEHRDSLGTYAAVRPGELNLMTGGHGICHSEVSTRALPVLHGVQLWVALPGEHRDAPRGFQHHVPELIELDGAQARVFLGSLAGVTSPVPTFTPLLGAEITLDPMGVMVLTVDPGFEHGVLVDSGAVTVEGTEIERGDLGYLGTGIATVTLKNRSAEQARLLLLGGEPFGEDIVMWWNFVGRSHDEIAQFRQEWQEESDRFGHVAGYEGALSRLPAPPLPNVRLTPRGNPR